MKIINTNQVQKTTVSPSDKATECAIDIQNKLEGAAVGSSI